MTSPGDPYYPLHDDNDDDGNNDEQDQQQFLHLVGEKMGDWRRGNIFEVVWLVLVYPGLPHHGDDYDDNEDGNGDDNDDDGGEYWETRQLLAHPGDPLHPHHRQHQQDHKSSGSNDPENQTQSKLQSLNLDKPHIVDSSVNDASEAVNLRVAQIKDGFTEADHVPGNIER